MTTTKEYEVLQAVMGGRTERVKFTASSRPDLMETLLTLAQERISYLENEFEEMRSRKYAAYKERNRLVALLARCFPSGLKKTAIEGWSEDWQNCVYIELPTGQASWHFHDTDAPLFEGVPPYTGEWDGHTTTQKYENIERLCKFFDTRPKGFPASTAPKNQRVLIYGTNHLGADECAMAWLDRIDSKWYYAPQGGLVQWTPDYWNPIPE